MFGGLGSLHVSISNTTSSRYWKREIRHIGKAKMKYICGSYFMLKTFRVGRQGNYFILLKHFTKKIAINLKKVPIFRYFYPKSKLMFKGRVDKTG